MASLLNHTVWVVQALIAMFFTYVFLGNFFKKKIWMEKIGMYGEGALMIATVGSFALFLWFMSTFMYSYQDPRHESFHMGSIVFLGMLAFACGGAIIYLIAKWQKSIPET